MVTLKNEHLSLTISEMGAEIIKAVDKNDKDIIWIGDEKFWTGHAPVLFPICGRLKRRQYIYNNEIYQMEKHGFSRRSVFEVEYVDNSSATFLLKANEQTLASYPFLFEFRVKYTLKDKTVSVDYIVDNKDQKELLFSVGAHEAYMCDKFEDCYVEFDKPVTLRSCQLQGNFINKNFDDIIENSTILPLNNKNYRPYDLIFKDIDFTAVTLKNKNGEPLIRAEFEDFPNLLIWSLPNAPYVCIEPWLGLPDYIDSTGIFEEKAGINTLAPNKTFKVTHSFTVY